MNHIVIIINTALNWKMTSKVVPVCLLIFLGKCWSINCVYDIPYVVPGKSTHE